MKIKELQRKGENLYSLTYEVGFWIFKKEITRDVYESYVVVRFVDNDSIVDNYSSINNLINHLKGYEPLKVNNI